MAMRTMIAAGAVAFLMVGVSAAQEPKPVPKDSVRVSVTGCVKGYMFTAGPRVEGEPGGGDIPEGMHLRMNGPKKMIKAIDAYTGSMVRITGLVRKGQFGPGGIGIGGGVRIVPPPAPEGGTVPHGLVTNPIEIDVEGWRPAAGKCPS
jgi:hypothetical protein